MEREGSARGSPLAWGTEPGTRMRCAAHLGLSPQPCRSTHPRQGRIDVTLKKLAAPRRELVSIAMAAEYLGVNPRTIRRRIAEGVLTGYRMGPRLVRVDLGEVDAMLRPIVPQ